MATSGTTAYSVTESDIITDVLVNIGVKETGQTIDIDDYTMVRVKLNMLVKQWTSQDFAPGLKMWCRRRGFLFLQANQVAYSLGPTGDECAADIYYTSTTTVASLSGASTITLASVTGFATTMRIGVLLSSGSIQWTTINGAPSGLIVTLTATLTADVASGARVFCYAAKIQRPFEIVSSVLHDTQGNDAPVDPDLSIGDYEAIPSKTATGTPQGFYFEAKRTNAVAYLDCQPTDLTNVIRIVYSSYVEDFTASTDTVDFPAEWFKALSAQVTLDCCPAFRKKATDEMKLMRDEGLRIAQHAYGETSEAQYESCPDTY